MNLSIGNFWGQVMANPLLMLAVLLTLGVILDNGWTDAPMPLPPVWSPAAYLPGQPLLWTQYSFSRGLYHNHIYFFNNYCPVAALDYKSPVQYKTELDLV